MKFNTTTAFLFICLIFFGCSRNPTIQKNSATDDADQKFSLLTHEMDSAFANQLDILSPRNFQVAKGYFEDAKKSLDNQKDPKETLGQITRARDYLFRANESAKFSHTNIGNVIIARQLALNAGATGLFISDFQRADNILRIITSDLEYNNSNKMNTEKHRKALVNIYSKLELAAIKHQNLAQARTTIAMAIKDGAEKNAAQNLVVAQKNYRDASFYIDSHRHEVNQIKALSNTANQSAYQLLQITHEFPNKISEKKIASTIEDQISTTLSAVIRKSNKVMDKKFERVRRKFTKDEAEVKKQGNTIIIRLRGLDFANSQVALKASNFPLLGKIKKVIKDFDKSSIVLEGHTDSIGSIAVNGILSQKRAEAVKEYLLSVDAIAAKNIKAIGSGERDPLATNNTEKGRAQNRRVDVLIQL